jgi:hypothetical protein
MKAVALEEVFPIDKAIQGLHHRKNAHEEYWLLLAKVTLSKFRENKKEMKKP